MMLMLKIIMIASHSIVAINVSIVRLWVIPVIVAAIKQHNRDIATKSKSFKE